jgi:ribulose-bisphosphate carboxylase large chain
MKQKDPIPQTVQDIKSVKIQGATNVAVSALNAIREKLKNFPETGPEELAHDFELLKTSRDTEPMMFNSLKFLEVEKGDHKRIIEKIDLLLSKIEDISHEIVEKGLDLIKNNAVILTHCHSSLVEKILINSVKKGKNITVFVTETRPLDQGKITVEKLIRGGVKVKMITDSLASNILINGYHEAKENLKVDLVFVGADAISKLGDVAFNKVGTFSVAQSASIAKIPLYVVSSLLKVSSDKVKIEVRSDAELSKSKHKNFDAYNPAFDAVPSKYIFAYLTEFGLIKQAKIKYYVEKYYPFIFQRKISVIHIKKESQININEPIKKTMDKTNPYSNYLHLSEKFNSNELLVATYRLNVSEGAEFLNIAGGVAAESSVGTWTKVQTQFKPIWDKLHARVFEADESSGIIKIAYPLDLFEQGNIAQLLSSVAGNIFGLKDIKNLRLLDLEMPEKYVKSFEGPAIGMEGVLKIAGVAQGPLIGSIIKPKLGLDFKEHVKVAMDVFKGGGNLVKDDENLTSQVFNPFFDRVKLMTDEMKKYQFLLNHEGEKIYAFNVTADANQIKERAEFVKWSGGNCAMIDILTAGFSSVQFLRRQNLGLILHGHRAMHAAFTRDVKEGVSMLVLAKLARLAGIDELHTGTVVGKMEGGEQEVVEINKFLTSEWFGLKKVMPVASGGLHPGMIPDLVKYLGKNVIYNFGGGIHGHPKGTSHGVRAVREGFEAVVRGDDWEKYMASHSDLKEAVEQWSK